MALAGMFALSAVLSGCSSSGQSKEAAPSTPSAALEMQYGKYDPSVSITYLRPWRPDVKFKSGEVCFAGRDHRTSFLRDDSKRS
jgi:putative aldouronate transport system substrate-binding protein